LKQGILPGQVHNIWIHLMVDFIGSTLCKPCSQRDEFFSESNWFLILDEAQISQEMLSLFH